MSYNGSGTFNINTAGQPVVTGTVISSTAFNALTADLGTGLSTAITKDGQTVATALIPFAAGMSSTTGAFSSTLAAGNTTITGTLSATGVTTLARIAATAAAGSQHTLSAAYTDDVALIITNTQASNPYGMNVSFSAADPNDATRWFFRCIGNGTERATIRSNGGLANYSANNVNLSDRREKTNFAPAKNYLPIICAIPVQTFNFIDQNLEEDPGLTLGVVAQDVQAVAPELVTESNWGTMEEPKTRLSIYQTDMQYALMKCIQEQQSLIESLTARIAALEPK